jgi:hypothetical protein
MRGLDGIRGLTVIIVHTSSEFLIPTMPGPAADDVLEGAISIPFGDPR